MAQSVKCLLHKQRDLFRSSAPILKLDIASVIPVLARQRQVDPWSSLSSQPPHTEELRFGERSHLRATRWRTTKEEHLGLMEGVWN